MTEDTKLLMHVAFTLVTCDVQSIVPSACLPLFSSYYATQQSFYSILFCLASCVTGHLIAIKVKQSALPSPIAAWHM